MRSDSGRLGFRLPQPEHVFDEMATFVSRALRLVERAPTFADVAASNVHRGRIGALQAAGIANGNNGLYSPSEALRRDQAASLVARALDHRP
ncbi:MAG: hypothetical protein WD010_09830 [Nitriliruptor sp.]